MREVATTAVLIIGGVLIFYALFSARKSERDIEENDLLREQKVWRRK